MGANADPPSPPAAAKDLMRNFGLNNRILMGGTLALLAVVFFVLAVHVYAKLFWRPSTNSAAAGRHRHLHRPARQPAPSAEGLDKSIIDSLPVFSYKSPPPSQHQPLLECAVCLLEFSENEEGRLLPSCRHSFHTDCIDMWFHSHSTCPLCRTVVTVPALEAPPKIVEESTSVEGSALALTLARCGSSSNLHSMVNDSVIPLNCACRSDTPISEDYSNLCGEFRSQGIGTAASPTIKPLPQTSADVLVQVEGSASCLSMCPSEGADEACGSQSLKSSSSRISTIRRLLSREGSLGKTRVSPTLDQEHTEHDEEAAITYQRSE